MDPPGPPGPPGGPDDEDDPTVPRGDDSHQRHRAEVAARRRRWWLIRQAEESATMLDLLIGLADDRRPITVRTATRTVGPVPIAEVGTDYVEVTTGDGALVIAIAAITSVSAPGPGTLAVSWIRERPAIGLVERLHRAVADQPRVVIRTSEGDVTGTLRTVGLDVVTVRTGVATLVHVPSGAIREVLVR